MGNEKLVVLQEITKTIEILFKIAVINSNEIFSINATRV